MPSVGSTIIASGVPEFRPRSGGLQLRNAIPCHHKAGGGLGEEFVKGRFLVLAIGAAGASEGHVFLAPVPAEALRDQIGLATPLPARPRFAGGPFPGSGP